MAASINASTSAGVVTTADTTGNLNLQSNGTTIVAITSAGATVTGTLTGTSINLGQTTLGAGNASSFKNRIINGNMVINQRYGTTLQTGASGFVTDRFQVLNSSAGTVNAQTVTTAPAGFTYSTQLTVGTADTAVGASDSVMFYQTIEGYNIADLNWAGANAKSITLSFWVYSSLIGTYSGSLVDAGGSVSYPFNYTISTANTWTQITQTIAGPVSGTFGSTNGVGFYLELSLMVGSSFQGTPNAWAAGNFRGTASQVNWMATSANTWFITGVQIEVGTVATSFDYRSYGTELMLCQRYLPAWSGTAGNQDFCSAFNNTATATAYVLTHPVQTRVPPTGVSATGTFLLFASNNAYTVTSLTFLGSSTGATRVGGTITAGVAGAGGAGAGQGTWNLYLTGCEL